MEFQQGARIDGPNGIAARVPGGPRRARRDIELGVVGRRVAGQIGGVISGHAPEELPLVVDIEVHPVRYVVVSVLLDKALGEVDRKSTRLNSSHLVISYAVFCLKKN